MNNLKKLRKCPGCGELPSLGLDTAHQLYYTCVRCCVSAEGADTVDAAAGLWNRMIRRREKHGNDAGD